MVFYAITNKQNKDFNAMTSFVYALLFYCVLCEDILHLALKQEKKETTGRFTHINKV